MKRITIALLAVVLLFIVGCSKDKAIPLEEPNIELFEVVSEEENFTLYKRIEIKDDAVYTDWEFDITEPEDSCKISDYHLENYRVLVNGYYFDLYEAYKLNILSCQIFRDLDVIITPTL